MSSKWAQVEMWIEYDPAKDQYRVDGLVDAMFACAHDNEPAGLDVHVSATMSMDAPAWASD